MPRRKGYNVQYSGNYIWICRGNKKISCVYVDVNTRQEQRSDREAHVICELANRGLMALGGPHEDSTTMDERDANGVCGERM